ncbi:MAG: SsrA-binding protein [Candidatus Omnitrophica bacterium CG11_big_fil_rev_8_21_14_0_20_64_10]|nr:MAG: SsrA-binding protein [Candidatus Omnitrophica bacterium CG11_big_fil_rev_8_21_14_0_20_64_10]
MTETETVLIAKNPSAGHNFELLEKVEAGLQLQGSEVKSLRARKANLRDAFARVEKGEVFLHGMDISPYAQAGPTAPPAKRVRRLLLHRAQIARLEGKLGGGGLTLVATRLYFKGSLVKVELALARGKKRHDKRESLKKHDARREIERALRRKV